MHRVLRIEPGGYQSPWLRIGGPGLANLLWLWSKMVIVNHMTGIEMEWPVWRQLKPQAMLRGEWSMGYYPELFSKTSDYLRRSPKRPVNCKRIDGDMWLDHAGADGISHEPFEMVFMRVSDPFEALFEYREVVSRSLRSILPTRYDTRNDSSEINVAIHIRRGDFRGLGLACELDDYLVAIDNFRDILPKPVKFILYTDAGKDDKDLWSRIPEDVEVAGASSPLEDLLSLSTANYLIGTARSSFSRMACFLGGQDIIWCGDDRSFERVRDLTPTGSYIARGNVMNFS